MSTTKKAQFSLTPLFTPLSRLFSSTRSMVKSTDWASVAIMAATAMIVLATVFAAFS